MEQVILKLSEQDYRELLACVRWVASDAISDRNRIAAFALAKRIEASAEEVRTNGQAD